MIEVFEKEYDSVDYLIYKYNDPFEFGYLVSNMDMILTSKLHVGVTAALKNKAVLAVAVHPEKTIRFYKQIDALMNFMNLDQVSDEMICEQMNITKDLHVSIPKKVYSLANKNLNELSRFITEIKEDKIVHESR